MTHENIWRPASGYKTESGKWKWRCWNESLPGGQKELRRRDGKTWLCDTWESALQKCNKLNTARGPRP